jgi:hypothetical protein
VSEPRRSDVVAIFGVSDFARAKARDLAINNLSSLVFERSTSSGEGPRTIVTTASCRAFRLSGARDNANRGGICVLRNDKVTVTSRFSRLVNGPLAYRIGEPREIVVVGPQRAENYVVIIARCL